MYSLCSFNTDLLKFIDIIAALFSTLSSTVYEPFIFDPSIIKSKVFSYGERNPSSGNF